MDAILDDYQQVGVASVFLYTHEAHPGEHYPHLTSIEQKFAHARALRDEYGVRRPILVDALAGDCHIAYGSMPNMAWIINGAGIPVYKADWTDAASVRNAVEYLLGVLTRKAEGEALAPFNVARLDYRTADRPRFYAGLERSGKKAVEEFRKAFGP